MIVRDLGLMDYRSAWALQQSAHADVVGGDEEQLLLVEHPPVITFGRRPNVQRNLIASEDQLARLAVEVVQSDRGGDITFHGPGQLVAYPIIRLLDYQLSVGAFVRRLQETVIAALRHFDLRAENSPDAIGVWVNGAKICALGVRIRRGTSMHGIALNITTDLRYFDLIVPCGLCNRPVTSMQQLLGDRTPPIHVVKSIVAEQFLSHFKTLASPSPARTQ